MLNCGPAEMLTTYFMFYSHVKGPCIDITNMVLIRLNVILHGLTFTTYEYWAENHVHSAFFERENEGFCLSNKASMQMHYSVPII